jgi:hypothetical protein
VSQLDGFGRSETILVRSLEAYEAHDQRELPLKQCGPLADDLALVSQNVGSVSDNVGRRATSVSAKLGRNVR